MKSVIAFAASGLCGAAMAFPEVSDVSMTQDANRLVTITYALSEPAVVTFDILTNNTATMLALYFPRYRDKRFKRSIR